jgi:serine/threonine protein kinase
MSHSNASDLRAGSATNRKRASVSTHSEQNDTKKGRHSHAPCFEHIEEFPGPRVTEPILFADAPCTQTVKFRFTMPDQRLVDAHMEFPAHTAESYADEISKQDSSKLCYAKHRVFQAEAKVFEHIRPIGHGSFGMVDEIKYSGTILTDGERYARKIIRCPKQDQDQQDKIRRELEIIKLIRHDHIVRTRMTYEEPQGRYRTFGIIMEPVAESNLQEYLVWAAVQKESPPNIIRGIMQTWFGCLASALAYLHSKRIRHKDIKPVNILVRNEQIFFTDFGLSCQFDEGDKSGSAGSPGPRTIKYSAPEVEAGKERGRKADVFSLGCVYLEVLTLLAGSSLKDFQESLQSDVNKAYFQFPKRISDWLLQLQPCLTNISHQRFLVCTLSMLQHDPQTRASSFEVASRLANCGTNSLKSEDQKDLCPCRGIFGPIGDCSLTM